MAVVVAPMDMAAAESAAVETMVVVLAVEVAVVHVVAAATAAAAIAIGLVAAVVAAVAVAEEVAMQVAVVEVAAKEVVAQVAALAVVDQFVAAVAVATAVAVVAVVAVATADVATVPVVATAMGVVALAILAAAAVDVDVVVVAVEVAAGPVSLAATVAMEWIPWIQWQWWWQPWWVKWWQVLGIPLVALNTRQPNCQRMMKRTHLHMAHPSTWVIPIIGLQIWNTNLALQTSDLLVVSSSGLRPKDSASLRAKSSPKFLVVTLMFSYIIFRRDITNKVTSSSSVSSSISEVNLKAHHTWNSEDWIRVVRKQTTSTFTTLS